MKNLVFALLILSFFACKKEEKNVVQVQSVDSTVYYNKWTKMNKVPYSLWETITDVSYQANKSMALLSNNKIFFVDSGFNLKTSPNFLNNSGNSYMKYQTVASSPNFKNTFYYLINPQSGTGKSSQVIVESNLYGTEIITNFFTRSYFIKDTNQNNFYTYIGYGYDYFAYNIYNNISGYKYLLNYRNYSKKIDTAISINSNVSYNTTFRLRDNVVFWNYFDNVFATVNTNTMELQTNQSMLKDFRFIGTYNNYAYFYNFKANGIFKTNNLLDFELVYEYKYISRILPFFNEKYMLIKKYKDTNDDTIIEEFTLLNIENNTSKIISLPFENYEEIMCHWVIDNTLYVLTKTNIYARKF